MDMDRSAKTLLLPAAGCALAALLLYLPFRSASLDDFDSYNFVRALADFNPARFQPQPPGYVLYVWLGRAALALLGDPRLALTALSAFSAALACGLLFLIGSLLFNRRSGLLAVLLVIATPLMWLNAGKALSDATGLCAQAIGALALVLALRRRLPLWLAAGLIGVAAGFRPQAVLGLGLAWIALALWQRTGWRAWLSSIGATAAGLLTWLLPTLAALNWNVDALRGYLSAAAGFVAGQESLFATALSLQSVLARLGTVWAWASRAVFGPQPEWLLVALAVGGLALALRPALRPAFWPHQVDRRAEIGLIWLWLLPQAVLQVLFLNPELTRYLLALLFPAAVLVAAGLDNLWPESNRLKPQLPNAHGLAGWTQRLQPARLLPLCLALGFCALTGAAALPLAQTLHTVPAPPDQLAQALAQRLPREQTFILAKQSYNALAYLLPGWQVRFADAYDPAALPGLLEASHAPNIVIADPDNVQPGEQYVQVDTLQFARDPQVHAKHALVSAYIYGLTTTLSAADFALPADGVIHIGLAQDGKYVLGGWYRREDIGGAPGRWIGSEVSASLRVLLPARQSTLTLRASSFAPDQTISLACDGRALGPAPLPAPQLLPTPQALGPAHLQEPQPLPTPQALGPAPLQAPQPIPVPQGWTDISFELPAGCAYPDRPTRIDIVPAIRRAPSDDGASTDHRQLAIALSEIRIR